jgi:hypothetical protein
VYSGWLQVNIDLTSPAPFSHTQIFTEPGWKKFIHFACQFEALESGISRIQKQFQNPESLMILELLWIPDIPFPSASNWHAK